MHKISLFFSELLRRKVVRFLGAYLVVLWFLAQGVADIFPAIGFPEWSVRAFIFGGVALVPVFAWISWKYDFVPPKLALDAGSEAETRNLALIAVQRRHNNFDAGFVMVKWQADTDKPMEKRFFKAISLGRDPSNEVRLTDTRVSRFHAVLWAEDGKWHLKDSSTNGTWLNHVRITEPIILPVSCDLQLQLHPNGPIITLYVDKPAQTMMS